MRAQREPVNLGVALSTLPAVAALTVGLLYVLGALSLTGQFVAADISTATVLPLVPLPHILGSGIRLGVVVLIGLPLLGMFAFIQPLAGRWGPSLSSRRLVLLGVVLFSLLGFAALLTLPWEAVAALGPLVVIAWFLARWLVRSGFFRRERAGALWVFAGAYLLLVHAVISFAFPAPLPEAEGRAKLAPETVEGTVALMTDDQLILRVGEDRLRVLKRRDVERLDLRVPRRDDEPVLDWLRD